MNRHPAARNDVVGDRGGLAELVLAGLVAEADEDEVLGDLAEGRALCAAAQGERPARRWYRRQVLRALPPLVLHGLKTRPWFVVLGALGALTVTALVEWGVELGGSYDSRLSLEPRDVLVETIWRGAALLFAGAVGGAVAAWLARGARLVAVANTLDSITSDLPYRPAQSLQAAREEIAKWSGSQFDPEIVKTFLEMPDNTWEGLRREIEAQIFRVSVPPTPHGQA